MITYLKNFGTPGSPATNSSLDSLPKSGWIIVERKFTNPGVEAHGTRMVHAPTSKEAREYINEVSREIPYVGLFPATPTWKGYGADRDEAGGSEYITVRTVVDGYGKHKQRGFLKMSPFEVSVLIEEVGKKFNIPAN